MLKVAIIGAGAISPSHIQAYLKFSERCEIVAICDIYVDKAQSRIDQFQLTAAKAVSDYKELLGLDIDLISVCTPPYTHAPITVDFCRLASMYWLKSRWHPRCRNVMK